MAVSVPNKDETMALLQLTQVRGMALVVHFAFPLRDGGRIPLHDMKNVDPKGNDLRSECRGGKINEMQRKG